MHGGFRYHSSRGFACDCRNTSPFRMVILLLVVLWTHGLFRAIHLHSIKVCSTFSVEPPTCVRCPTINTLAQDQSLGDPSGCIGDCHQCEPFYEAREHGWFDFAQVFVSLMFTDSLDHVRFGGEREELGNSEVGCSRGSWICCVGAAACQRGADRRYYGPRWTICLDFLRTHMVCCFMCGREFSKLPRCSSCCHLCILTDGASPNGEEVLSLKKEHQFQCTRRDIAAQRSHLLCGPKFLLDRILPHSFFSPSTHTHSIHSCLLMNQPSRIAEQFHRVKLFC